MKMKFLGGVRTVTGSCIHLSVNDCRILIDCGLHQGEDADEQNSAPFAFDPAAIDSILLTHAHLDHSGLIPRLTKAGFTGDIIATAATADLATVLLYDSAHIQERDAAWLTKKSFRAGADITFAPLYTTEDVRALASFFKRHDYGRLYTHKAGLKYRFLDAGHILGSGTLELWYEDGTRQKKIVFSGDVGKRGNPIVRDPQPAETADFVVIESTYGNRLHKGFKESVDELAQAIKLTFKNNGNVLIPSFAVGRTQDILYILDKLVRQGIFPQLDVYVDSPLAKEATKVYLAHPELFDEEAANMLSDVSATALRLRFTTSVEESQRINKTRSGAIIIAGSGMCKGGRISHHLKHNLWRPECSIIFVGFQAGGTLGREIVDRKKKVRVLGEDIVVRARIYTIGGFSAHADQKELLDWLSAFSNKPEVFIVHGEEPVSLEFAEVVKQKLGFTAHVPYRDQEFEI